jgi:hypothetical protein
MRHRRKGRVLGRSPAHRKALFANMVSAIFLTERDTTELDSNIPKVPGRIITTLEKAKEIRPLVEKCITKPKLGLKPSHPKPNAAPKNGKLGAKAINGRNGPTLVLQGSPLVAASTPSFATKKQSAFCSPKSPPDSAIDLVATPASCAWPNHGWVTTELVLSWNSLAKTIALPRRPASHPSKQLQRLSVKITLSRPVEKLRECESRFTLSFRFMPTN